MTFKKVSTFMSTTVFLGFSVLPHADTSNPATVLQSTHLTEQLNLLVAQSLASSGQKTTELSIQSQFEGELSWQMQCPDWNIERLGQGPLLGRVTLHLTCTHTQIQRWVPALIKASAPVVIVRTPVRNGDSIPTENLGLEVREITWLHGNFFLHTSDVASATARRSLNTGVLVAPSDIAPPLLVRRGDQVMIEATAGNLTVSDVGIALNDASRGESVRVQHTDTGKIVQGYAIDHDVVRISL